MGQDRVGTGVGGGLFTATKLLCLISCIFRILGPARDELSKERPLDLRRVKFTTGVSGISNFGSKTARQPRGCGEEEAAAGRPELSAAENAVQVAAQGCRPAP